MPGKSAHVKNGKQYKLLEAAGRKGGNAAAAKR